MSARFSQRVRMRRKRLSQEWVRSTTQRRARKPASCLIALASSPRLADVGGEAELRGERVHLGVVVALVGAQRLRLPRCRHGPSDRDRLDRGAAKLEVVQVRARRRDPERDALALGEERSFRPFLALSVGLGPVSSPPRGALPSAPSSASHSHSIPCLCLVGEQPLPPEVQKHTRLGPLTEAPIGRRAATDPGRVERIPLHPRTQHEQDRIHRVPISNTRPMTAQRRSDRVG